MKIVLKYILIFVFVFILNINNTNAAKAITPGTLPACIDNGKCLELCEYENTWKEKDVSKTDKVVVYYMYSTKKLNVWFTIDGGKKATTVGVDSSNLIISEKKYFSNSSVSCAKYALVDSSAFDEVCFSTKGKYCSSKNSLTKNFKGKSKLTYNYENSINNYYNSNDNYFFDVNCDNFDLNNFEKQLITDFSTNFLNGNKIPKFIANSSAYKKGKDGQKAKIDEFKNKCIKEIDSDSSLTDSEKESKKEKFDFTDEELDNMLDNVEKWIDVGSANIVEVDLGKATCDSLFGTIDNPEDPAYYINSAFNIMKYLAIIFLIVFTILDFVQAVASKDDDALNKSTSKFTKRLIMAIIIFFLPILIELVMGWSGLIDDSAVCGITEINE